MKLVLSFALLLALPVWGVDLTLGELQRKLNAGNADAPTWQAAETEMSRLSFQEAKARMGATIDGKLEPQAFKEEKGGRDAWDWRNVGGVKYNSPILNQGRCGSCVAFAATTTLETQMNVTRKTPGSPWTYSPQHLFACGGGGCSTGWQPASAVAYMKSKGVPDEACSPYKSGALGEDIACSASCSDAAARSHKIVGSSMPSMFFPNPAAVKAALKKGPLIAVMYVYEDFLFYKSGVYKHTTGKMAGGHAITLIGYDDAAGAWICQNSWGPHWGENGYFRVAYDDTSGVGSQTWAVEVSPGTEGFVTLGSIRDYDVLKGKVTVDAKSTVQGSEAVAVTVNKGGVPVGFLAPSLIDGRLELDTSKYPDGAYTIYGSAGTAKSQEKSIYILNGKHNGSFVFTNIKDGDTVKGEQKLNFNVTQTPVPFSKIVFRTTELATGDTSTRSTGLAYAKMQVGWRAQLVPNGKYKLELEGYIGDKLSYKIKPLTVTVAN